MDAETDDQAVAAAIHAIRQQAFAEVLVLINSGIAPLLETLDKESPAPFRAGHRQALRQVYDAVDRLKGQKP